MLQVALRRSRGQNCLSSMTLNLETVRVCKLRKSHYYIQATKVISLVRALIAPGKQLVNMVDWKYGSFFSCSSPGDQVLGWSLF